MPLTSSRRIVIKIGSALLIDEKTQSINTPWLISLIDDVVALSQEGIELILVSSGAIACGKINLGITGKHLSLDKQQAASAVGQIQLIHTYQSLLKQKNLKAAQILLTLDDSENRRRSLNLRNTLNSLLAMKVIPIINENDSVATSEIRYGDNDRLAARVAQMINADTLILLSDVDGLYTSDPKRDNSATFIETVEELSPSILSMAKTVSSQHGSGGMITKLAAAKIAMSSGCRMLITAGKPLHPIQHFISTKRGTWFLAKSSPKQAKKSWLKEHLQPLGTVNIDLGAQKALKIGASLLPVGITEVIGVFQKGSPISIMADNKEIARGLTNYSHLEIQKILGKSTKDISNILGYEGCHEVIHRDNLVEV